jgi:hypothetical protein
MMAAPDLFSSEMWVLNGYISEAYTRGLEREVLAVTSISFSLA